MPSFSAIKVIFYNFSRIDINFYIRKISPKLDSRKSLYRAYKKLILTSKILKSDKTTVVLRRVHLDVLTDKLVN